MAQSVGALTSAIPTSHQGQGVILRGCSQSDSFALPTSSSNAKVFPFAQFSGGMIYVDGACAITWYVASSATATVAAAKAYDGTVTPVAIAQTPAGAGWFEIPPNLFGAPFVAPVIASGTVNAILCLKK